MGTETMSQQTFAAKILAFNASLQFDAKLPEGISVMNPFRENACAIPATKAFYEKYYNDCNLRHIILGINPGRFGAGLTGVPFSDPKRLAEFCDIHIPQCPHAHEPSSEFVYSVVQACGGPKTFYAEWFITSLCPLGFIKLGKNGRQTNYNYYDNSDLARIAEPFIVKTLSQQIEFGIYTDLCFCLGTGKNAAFIKKLNEKYGFFGEIIPLEHPRYIMQYKYGQRDSYVRKYCQLLAQATGKAQVSRL